MSNIINLLTTYVESGYLGNVLLPKYFNYYKKHNINIFNEFIKDNVNIDLYQYKNKKQDQQIGGDIFTTKLSNIKYSFEYFKAKPQNDYTKAIIIKRLNDNSQIDKTTEHYQSKHCALLLYNGKEILHLAFLNMYSDCYKSEEKNKSGSILLKLIILWGKEQGFKKITLSDQAMYDCKDNNFGFRYEIKYLHTLTHGKTWYAKYGFSFVNNIDKENQKYNKQILDKIKTKDYPLEILLRMIMRKIVDDGISKLYDSYNYLDSINQIIKLYDAYANESFYSFMKILSREYCIITSNIYMSIYESLKLKPYISSEMEMVIN